MRWSGARRALAALTGALLVTVTLTACAPDRALSIDAPEQVEGALPEATLAELNAAVQGAMAAAGASGAIVGVWVPWSGTWVEGIGVDAVGAPVTPDLGFRVGNLTRLMTCDVMYSLAADGLLTVDDPVSDYVAGAPDLDEVTLKQLCDGSAGLGSSEASVRGSWLSNSTRVWTPLELAAFGLGRERTAPGTGYRDSDAGYVLLGLALERAGKASMANLLKERVFEPLQLTDTRLPGARAASPSAAGGALSGYRLGRTPEGALDCTNPIDASVVSASIGYADSGVVSTVTDLGRYLSALGAGTLDRTEDPAARWSTPFPATANAPAWYTATGGGLQAGSLIGQYGWMPGYLTAGFVDPGTGMTVVVVLNNSAGSADIAGQLAWQLAAIASKAPAAAGATAPDFGLPWTPEQYAESIAAASVGCQ